MANKESLEQLECSCFAATLLALVFGGLSLIVLGVYTGTVADSEGAGGKETLYVMLGLSFAVVFLISLSVCSITLCVRTVNQHSHPGVNETAKWLAPTVFSLFFFVSLLSLFLMLVFYVLADNNLSGMAYEAWWWVGLVSLAIFVSAYTWLWCVFASDDSLTWACCCRPAEGKEGRKSLPDAVSELLTNTSKLDS